MRQDRTRRRELRRPWRVGRVGVLAAWLVVAPPGLPRAVANPEGEQVVVGEASFARDAAVFIFVAIALGYPFSSNFRITVPRKSFRALTSLG